MSECKVCSACGQKIKRKTHILKTMVDAVELAFDTYPNEYLTFAFLRQFVIHDTMQETPILWETRRRELQRYLRENPQKFATKPGKGFTRRVP